MILHQSIYFPFLDSSHDLSKGSYQSEGKSPGKNTRPYSVALEIAQVMDSGCVFKTSSYWLWRLAARFCTCLVLMIRYQ